MTVLRYLEIKISARGDAVYRWMAQLQVKSLLLAWRYDKTSQIVDSCDDLLFYDIVMLSGYYASDTSMLRNILFCACFVKLIKSHKAI